MAVQESDIKTDNSKSLNWETNTGREIYPEFINNSIEQYFEERVKKSWQGRHILNGKTPTPDALIFSSNDYLHISQHPDLIKAQTR
ncbi:MAG: hypothetical protein M1486_05815, partial [Gammaproteobacteria bacterium]|nr:hypothetical protein [Gammaproteobacteria bacterium]